MPIARREFLQGLAGAPLLQNAQLKRRPNVILILSDDQGYGDTSLHGNTWLKTPSMEKLASQSTEFTRFYVSPVCAPTRCSLLTGRYNLRAGVHGVTGGRETMASNETTIAEALRPAGYRTVLYGKWHLGQHYPNVPHAQGFDEFIGFRTGHFLNYWDPQLERNGKPYPVKGYITEALTDLAIRFLEKRPSPFFLYLAYNVPHTPFQVPDQYWKRFQAMDLPDQTRAAYALTACLDDNIGRLLAKLDELKMAEETIVIFLSDNGPAGDRFNSGLRGKKASVWEGGNRVPFLIRWPGVIPAGRKVDAIAAHIDLYPTLLELCRAPQPDGALPIDGRSLTPLLAERPGHWDERALYFHHERPAEPDARFPGTVRTQRFNLVNGENLYEIPSDPGETKDVAAQYPEEKRRLQAAYERWFRSVLPAGGLRRQPIPVGWDEENPAFLPAPEGNPHGKVAYKGGAGYAHDWFVNWKSADDWVHWDVDAEKAGRYEVTLRYLCPEGSTGSVVEVRAGARSVEAALKEATSMEPLPNRNVTGGGSAPGGMRWKKLKVGTLEMMKGAGRVEVRARPAGGIMVMELDRVWLRRIG
jgi:arylsulfatase A